MTDSRPTDDGSTDSRRLVNEACRRAATLKKRVAVIFGADWCPDSDALDDALKSPYVAPILDRGFEVVPVDVGQRDRNLELLAEYGMDVWRGIPAVAVVETDGTLVAAQTAGELANARTLQVVEIASIFHRFLPEI